MKLYNYINSFSLPNYMNYTTFTYYRKIQVNNLIRKYYNLSLKRKLAFK